jgi:alanine-glyoxylate transaminase / serine-glyoxylate transaminase / serine-pyruvate transaminase
MLRKLFQTTDPASQPFVISGSGTLGWDLVAANLVEAGEEVLVLNTGYFSDGFGDCLTTYGAKVTHVKAPVGGRPQLPEIEKALLEKKYKMITVTHVDTSTGVLSELKDLAAVVHKVSPETLLIVDGVCSVACEEIAFDEWKLDGVVTASQKAIGCPAGLSISMFSGRAMEVFQARKSPPSSYFASMKNWTPSESHDALFSHMHPAANSKSVMKNYEAKKPSYFATPSPQLIHALHTALTQILARPLAARFSKHKEVSDRIKQAVTDLGLKQVAGKPEDQAHSMTAIYLPDNVKAIDILPNLAKSGVIFAGGVHKEIAPKYIRFGHMGVSVVSRHEELRRWWRT